MPQYIVDESTSPLSEGRGFPRSKSEINRISTTPLLKNRISESSPFQISHALTLFWLVVTGSKSASRSWATAATLRFGNDAGRRRRCSNAYFCLIARRDPRRVRIDSGRVDWAGDRLGCERAGGERSRRNRLGTEDLVTSREWDGIEAARGDAESARDEMDMEMKILLVQLAA
ncbi:hypothetical protein DFH06DRAFT_1137746 [Mycena polygramma]|nr:hypothetical protein DFH06DRAFT_1137746 [Mycena polygramma]